MKTRTKIIIGLAVLAVIVLAIIAIKYFNENRGVETTTTTSETSGLAGLPSGTLSNIIAGIGGAFGGGS